MLITEAFMRSLMIVAFFSLTKEFNRVFGMLNNQTKLAIIVFTVHIVFEKLGEITRGINSVDTEIVDPELEKLENDEEEEEEDEEE